MKQTLVFRIWLVRQGDSVWVRKLTDVVTSLLLRIYKLDKESMECNTYVESPNNIKLE